MIYSFQLLRLAPACGRPWCGRVNYGRYFCTAVDPLQWVLDASVFNLSLLLSFV